ncbi:MAG: hypothetical protein ABWX84_01175 [Nocardioides sp.]
MDTWRGQEFREGQRRLTAPRLALLPSPLLGPRVWAAVAARLRDAGRDVVTPSARGASPGEVLAALLDGLPADRELVLVPHSNAGLYAPAVAAARPVAGCVFVDAALPADAGSTATAPPALVETLRSLAGADGLLPAWTHWWPEADTAALFPSAQVRTEVEAEQTRLPLSYFGARVPTPPWADLDCAYLAFGPSYGVEEARARAAGWPVAVLDGRHLHMLVDPDTVSETILALEPTG